LQKKVLMDLRPQADFIYPPNPYSPFVGILFRPLARMPYSTALLLWSSISFSLYIAGLILMTNCFFPRNPHRSLIFCFALSLYPLVMVLNLATISTIGFFALAVAFCEQARERPVLSGLSLSVCLYKPTLLLLFLPMLLVRRRYRTLAGFAGGGLTMAAFVTAVQGFGVWPGYIRMLLSFGSAALRTHGYKKLTLYVDLSTFSALLPGGHSWPGRIAFFAAAFCAALYLFRAWRNSANAGKTPDSLIWATTLTWTLVLNLYVPVTDCILVVLSLIATSAGLTRFPPTRWSRLLTLFWPLITVSSWIMAPLAESARFQILTVVFALLGILQFIVLRKTSQPCLGGGPCTGRLRILSDC
jgi:hypothetical protein